MPTQTVVVADKFANPQGMTVFHDGGGNVMPAVTFDSSKATYRFSASFTPLVTSAVTLFSIQGSATKTVRVRRIFVGGTSTTNPGSSNYALYRVSALGSGGTGVNPTAAKLDTNDAAATAVVTHYTTAAQSSGTKVGGPITSLSIGTSTITLPTTGPVPFYSVFPEGGIPAGKAIVLRGTGDYLEFQNANAGSLPAGTVLQYVVELEEDDS
jgi:hypothetical protein